MKCSVCGGENSESTQFCKHCGVMLSASAAAGLVACPECGAANKASAGFCVACGHGLGKRAALPEEQVVPAHQAPQSQEVAPSVSEEHKAPVNIPAQERGRDLQDQFPANTGESLFRRPSKLVLWLAGVITIGSISLTGYLLFGGNAKTPAPEQENEAETAVAAPVAEKPDAHPAPPDPVGTTPPDASKPADAIKQPAIPADGRVQPPRTSTRKEPSVPPEPAKPQPTPSAASSDKPDFDRELAACRTKGFFERGVCTEQVRWKYCSVNGVWDTSKPNCER